MENIQTGFWVKKGQELSGPYTFDNLAQRGIEISKKYLILQHYWSI